jgi:hypothetical protein
MVRLDPIADAYAVLECRPGCSRSQLKKQYKGLVSRWHPDRYAQDPVRHAEAEQRLREIIRAYDLLEESLRNRDMQSPPASDVRTMATNRTSGQGTWRPLSTSEIEAITQTIGTTSGVSKVIDFLSWFAPLAAAVVLIQPDGPRYNPTPPTAYEVSLAFVCLLVGVAALIRKVRKAKR